MTRRLLLIRHGQTTYNATGRMQGHLDTELSEVGYSQARAAADLLEGKDITAILSSDLIRARDTAEIIGEDFPGRHFEVVDDLAECTPPTRRTEVTADEKLADLAACKKQFDRLFARYFKPAIGPAQTELMVCHGNVIRNMVVRALGVDSRAWLEMSVGNASITRILVEPDGRFKVISLGDVGHIPPNLRTGATGDPERSLAVPALP